MILRPHQQSCSQGTQLGWVPGQEVRSCHQVVSIGYHTLHELCHYHHLSHFLLLAHFVRWLFRDQSFFVGQRLTCGLVTQHFQYLPTFISMSSTVPLQFYSHSHHLGSLTITPFILCVGQFIRSAFSSPCCLPVLLRCWQ